MEVVFYTESNLTETITSDKPNLLSLGTFVKADCRKGQAIIYKEIDYNSIDSTPRESQVLEQGAGLITLRFPAASIRRVATFETEGVVLYQHAKYGGIAETVPDQQTNIKFGVSSMIISGGKWELYTKSDFVGPHATKDSGKYPNPGDLQIGNDTMKSIKKVD